MSAEQLTAIRRKAEKANPWGRGKVDFTEEYMLVSDILKARGFTIQETIHWCQIHGVPVLAPKEVE